MLLKVCSIILLADAVMNKNAGLLFMAGLLLTGCVKTVNRQELDAAIHSHEHETVSWVSYAGSKDGFHYIQHGHTIGSDNYRIAESDLKIDNPFPLTKDEGKWRTLKKNWELWGTLTIITNSKQGAAPLPSAPQAWPSEGVD